VTTTVAIDLDGTVLDCRERQVALAAALVPSLDCDRFWADKREGATTCAAFERQGVPAAAEVAARWAAAVEDDEWLARDAPLPGAVEALRLLRARPARLVVITARRRFDAVSRQLTQLGLRSAVDAFEVVDPRAPKAGKTPLLRSHAATVMIGDTESDAAAAAAAGIRFLAVSSGQRSARYLAACGAAEVHDDLTSAARTV
jgi:phosphoglycolate phosphatase-like HAD superfamily hydrolase